MDLTPIDTYIHLIDIAICRGIPLPPIWFRDAPDPQYPKDTRKIQGAYVYVLLSDRILQVRISELEDLLRKTNPPQRVTLPTIDVQQTLDFMGKRPRRDIPPETLDAARKLLKMGLSLRAVAKAVDVPKDTLSRRL